MKQDELIRTALFLRASQTAKLETLSQLTGVPKSELIRRAIDAYLELRKAELLRR